MTTTDLAALLARVEAATTWFDRSTLNADLAITLGGYALEKRGRDAKAWYYPVRAEPGQLRRDRAPDYTASLDAALALCERVLPGCRVDFHRNAEGAVWCAAIPPATAIAPTPALALLAALLKAKLSLSATDTSDAELGPGMPDENSLGPLV